ARSRHVTAGWKDHAWRMGTPHGPAAAVRLSASGAELAGRRRAAEHEGPSCGIAFENRTRPRHRANFSAGAAGQVAEAAELGARCRAGARHGAGADLGRVGKALRPVDRHGFSLRATAWLYRFRLPPVWTSLLPTLQVRS